jgi:hypothetical protein
MLILWLLIFTSAGGEMTDAQTPPLIEAYVVSLGGAADKISRDARRDVGEYRAYGVDVASQGPGDPGHWTIYEYKDEPWLKTKGDWSGFLRAAPPHRVAQAIAGSLDLVLRLADAQASGLSQNLQVTPYDQTEPTLTAQGSLVFFVRDGKGDPPSWDIYRVTATPKLKGGIDIQRVWVRGRK